MQGRLPTGVDRVGLAYLTHYRHHARAVLTEREVSAVLSSADSQAAFDLLLGTEHQPALARRLIWKARLWSWMRNDFPLAGSILLNTSHRGLEHPRYVQSLRRQGVLPVLFIHDLIPITHPDFCRDAEQALHRDRLRHAMAWGAGIITNSEDTRSQLLRLAAESGWPHRPVTAALLGNQPLPPATAAPPLAGSYFVMLGTIEPRKNHALMLSVWRTLAASLAADCPTLVVIGQPGWKCDDVMTQLKLDPALAGHVIHLDRCGDAELAGYLRHATALLFPSFAEGYGLPLTEALSAGLPVIASDLPVFAEIARDIPDYASPFDEARWLELVKAYARPQSPARDAQVERIKAFRPATWAGHFEAVDRFLDDIAAGSLPR